jgi:dsDNA-binding SOS-regulon protein
MRKVVFLDFDGVLHRLTTGTFRKLPLFCEFLRQNEDVSIVISSTWRLQYPLEELREFFEADVRDQIIDVTPDLTVSAGLIALGATRCEEISNWLARNRDVTRWAILDDESGLFKNHRDRLVLTDASEGLVPANLAALSALLGGSA